MNKKQTGLLVGGAALLALTSGVARAQSLRPNVLVIFDTSGSMLYNQVNDGSPQLCNNANLANGQTSRIYRLKNALRQALAQVGTDEANFGLMRFAQTENPSATAVCPSGHYSQGNGGGCRLSSDASANNTTGAEVAYASGGWFDTGASQALLVPVTKASTGLKPLAASDFDPSGGNISAIYRWIDQTEAASGTPAVITDPELRSPPNNSTPLGRSLYYARLYFDNYVKALGPAGDAGPAKPLDPKAACRSNLVILVTDGGEACDTTKGTSINQTTCATTGTYATYNPELQACKLRVTSKVPTYLLTDSGLTAPEKTAANAIATAGGTGPTAIYVTLTDTNAVKQALLDIIAKTVPPPEVCNGKDDNCNGLIDEGVSNSCTVAAPNDPNDPDNLLGTAAKHCAVESCDCQDNNCNGLVDEGCLMNACGKSMMCPVPPELCNGLDDNCDGDIDEGFNVGGMCTNGGVGACLRGGVWLCNSTGGRVCDAPVVTPQPELCNNIDDNCNGQVDEGTLPGVGVACGTALGNCHAGVTQCVNGKIICSTSSMPMTEVCNGLDDNCNGIVDEGPFTQTGQTCICAGLDPAKVGVGTCKAGHLVCRGSRGFVCEGCVLPGPEICDGLDNDCDGVADMNPICPSGLGCKEGRCTILCTPGEFPCPNGYKCVGDYCVPQRCAGKTCPTDQRCDENTGSCVDLCASVMCHSPQICQHGQCVDCYTLGCPAGQMCNAGMCQTDRCLGVNCGTNQYCDNGNCVDLCTLNKCPSSQRCVGGACMSNNCATMPCPGGQFCDQATGQCRIDTCAVTQCGKGQRCIPETGMCEADPCNTVNCPGPCWVCAVTTDGMASCQVSGDCRQLSAQIGIKGGGDGCGCAVGDASNPSSLAFAIAALGLCGTLTSTRRRRRR